MTLQNRVDPWGDLHAVLERGTMMGNRGGRFHRDDQTLGQRRWASRHWICCELHWKNAHHEPMGQGYTSLFFLDEVTALAAGHRPCFFCRRAEAKAFLGERKVADFDRQLHAERLQRLTLRCPAQPGLEGSTTVQHASRAAARPPQHEEYSQPLTLRCSAAGGASKGDTPHADIPDGAMLEIEGAAFAVRGPFLLRWSFAGYTERLTRKPSLHGRLLTCPSIAAILRAGYQPRWHRSANQWGTE